MKYGGMSLMYHVHFLNIIIIVAFMQLLRVWNTYWGKIGMDIL
jgi:hypothetical protein